MKKLLCILSVCTLITATAGAQHTQFGLKAGLNVSSVAVTGADDLDSKAGLHVGGLAHIHLNRHFALQPEVVYSMQGGKTNNSELKLNYINIPLLAQYMLNDGFRLQTGPQLGFLTMAKSKVNDLEVNRKDDYAGVDFSWAFGAGYIFPQGWGIDARYNLGITNVSDNNAFEARNRVFQVGLFYQFPATR